MLAFNLAISARRRSVVRLSVLNSLDAKEQQAWFACHNRIDVLTIDANEMVKQCASKMQWHLSIGMHVKEPREFRRARKTVWIVTNRRPVFYYLHPLWPALEYRTASRLFVTKGETYISRIDNRHSLLDKSWQFDTGLFPRSTFRHSLTNHYWFRQLSAVEHWRGLSWSKRAF